jgi:hypothetical protein
MQTVAETPIFIRRAESLLSEEEHFDLITYLATHPTVGDEIVCRNRRRAQGQIRRDGPGQIRRCSRDLLLLR